MDCSVCGKKAEPAYSVTHRGCGHATHADCIAGESVGKQCHRCLNPDLVLQEGIGSGIEPHTSDGVDYVKTPGTKSKGWSVGAVVSLVSRKPTTITKTPLELIKESTPIDVIFKKHKYGLDHMLKEGVTINDFLASRYKWEDICAFEDISQNGPHRSLLTFTNGLKLNANHLRDNPDRLPIDAFRSLTQLENSQLCTALGMEFPQDASLQCCGDSNWNAKDCVRLGLQMGDLIDFGLYCVEQYMDLMKGLSTRDQEEAEKKLGVTAKHLEGLRNLEEEANERRMMQAKMEEERGVEEEEEGEGDVEEEDVEEVQPIKSFIKSSIKNSPKSPVVFEQRFRVNPKKEEPIKRKPNRMAHLGYTPKK